MGRRIKTEPRCRQLNLSLTESEMALLCRRAEAVGMRLAQFGRAMLLDEMRAVAAPASVPVSTTQRLAYQQLSRVGANLNQMMHFCHKNGYPPPADLAPLLIEVRRLLSEEPRDGA